MLRVVPPRVVTAGLNAGMVHVSTRSLSRVTSLQCIGSSVASEDGGTSKEPARVGSCVFMCLYGQPAAQLRWRGREMGSARSGGLAKQRWISATHVQMSMPGTFTTGKSSLIGEDDPKPRP